MACLLLVVCIRAVYDICEKEYISFGGAWYDTTEQALRKRADMTAESLRVLTPKTMLNKVYIDDIVEMAFVSNDDTLVTVTFVTNAKGQYRVYGYSEEIRLDDPSMFLLNGDPEQVILFANNQHNTTAWGWCYSGYSFTVNGITPQKETYTFECQGKTWSIDYW